MNELIQLVPAALAGVALGVLFFAGLWWTTQKGLLSNQPALWFSVSLLVRTVLMLAGLYYIGIDHWQRLIACLAGVVIARIILLRRFAASPAGVNHGA